MKNSLNQEQPSTSSVPLPQKYQDALLKTGIQAANLLTELIELKLMPDPRAKEMADVALEVLRLVNASPMMLQNIDSQSSEAEERKA